MTKYTDEQIIAYLKTLREGDVLTAVKDKGGEYTAGSKYVAKLDNDGDLYIKNDNISSDYIRIGSTYVCYVFVRFQTGVFEIPAQVNDAPFELTITQTYPTDVFDDKAYYIVHASVDGAGLVRLQALEAESKRAGVLAELYAKRDAIQTQIRSLEVTQ
ncbi:hypothetical protein [Sporosarcina koreensis]|uniref:hypothetical protein n=1 Tax=Sporosarcina koreensis TaxID=334735 RepID=UPI00075B986C|nr:hypothetical protein [Sporosarcina koreensis]